MLGEISDDVSLKVREQYEENPYPRWNSAAKINKRARNLLFVGDEELSKEYLRYKCVHLCKRHELWEQWYNRLTQELIYKFDQKKNFKNPRGGHFEYGRQGTTTTFELEKILTKLEDSYYTFLTPTGFGSVFLCLFSILRPGDEIIIADPVYSPTRILTEDFLKEFKIKTIFYDPANLKTLENNISKKTKLIFVENPGSNSFEFQDLGKIISIAKKNKIFTAMDNTWGTPYFLKPIKLGFDMAIVSATKYYSGHSDVMGGSLAVNKRVFKFVQKAEKISGLRMGPDDAYLIIRGLRTLDTRLD